MEPAHLTTDRLVMGTLLDSDVDAFVEAWRDPLIRRWTNVPSPGTREQAVHFIHDFCPRGWREDTNYLFGVRVKDTGELVGPMGVFGLSWVGRSERLASLGYWTLAAQRGRGYTSEAIRAVAGWAFTELGVDRIESVGEVTNRASLACVVKAGFTHEGTLRSRIIQDGVRRDAWMASLLPQDLGLPPSMPYQPETAREPGPVA
ncbi:GNAT family N-acetyltransferase [Streptomyces kanasensis]|uniref:GNAT family N-acetyltransferase n=1 Tax=Streptomyces kanasensis TaxID=936756 RepID=UPI003702E922